MERNKSKTWEKLQKKQNINYIIDNSVKITDSTNIPDQRRGKHFPLLDYTPSVM